MFPAQLVRGAIGWKSDGTLVAAAPPDGTDKDKLLWHANGVTAVLQSNTAITIYFLWETLQPTVLWTLDHVVDKILYCNREFMVARDNDRLVFYDATGSLIEHGSAVPGHPIICRRTERDNIIVMHRNMYMSVWRYDEGKLVFQEKKSRYISPVATLLSADPATGDIIYVSLEDIRARRTSIFNINTIRSKASTGGNN